MGGCGWELRKTTSTPKASTCCVSGPLTNRSPAVRAVKVSIYVGMSLALLLRPEQSNKESESFRQMLTKVGNVSR